MQIFNRMLIPCLAALLLLAGCGSQPSEPVKTFQMHGEVLSLDAAGRVATVKHSDIPGFMSAMTMGYPVKDQAEFSKLSVGEKITATVYQRGAGEFWIGNIQKEK
jgi:Cu/Ag efflux protein CusF